MNKGDIFSCDSILIILDITASLIRVEIDIHKNCMALYMGKSFNR